MANSKTARASDIAQHKLFSLNAKYFIPADAAAEAMLNDAGCFLDSVQRTLLALAMDLSDLDSSARSDPGSTAAMLFGASYLTDMARNLVNAVSGHPDLRRGGAQ